MKRLHTLPLLLLTALAASAQDNVRAAFAQFTDGNGYVRSSVSNDDGRTANEKKEFRVPASEADKLLAVYRAFDLDAPRCVYYRRQDAHSAEKWRWDDFGQGFHVGGWDDVNVVYAQYLEPCADGTHRVRCALQWKLVGQAETGYFEGRTIVTSQRETTATSSRPIPSPTAANRLPLFRAIAQFLDAPATRSAQVASWDRKPADGQWTSLYNIYGFTLSGQDSLGLAQLYEAFNDARTTAYSFIRKSPGETLAQEVSVLLNPRGTKSVFPLGQQRNWDIVIAYVNDPDYAGRRYAFILWSYYDRSRNQTVGEVIVSNVDKSQLHGGSRRGTGVPGNLFHKPGDYGHLYPFVGLVGNATTSSAPARFTSTPAAETPVAPVVSVAPVAESLVTPATTELQGILADKETVRVQTRRGETYETVDRADELRQRGVDLAALRTELAELQRDLGTQRALYADEVERCNRQFNAQADSARRRMESRMEELRATYEARCGELARRSGTMSSRQFERQMQQAATDYRNALNELRPEYTLTMERLADDFRRCLTDLETRYANTTALFDTDGNPNAFFQKLFTGLTAAFRGDGTVTDTYIAAKLRRLCALAAPDLGRAQRDFYQREIAALQSHQLSDNAITADELRSAARYLSGRTPRADQGTSPAKVFRREFREQYDRARRALKTANDADSQAAAEPYVQALCDLCEQYAPSLPAPDRADAIRQLNRLRSHYLRVSLHNLTDRAVQALSR